MTNKLIYLDSCSTTIMDSRVIDTVTFAMKEYCGNASSTSHKAGWKSLEKVEEARFEIANLINAQVDEIIFTSGATEANNLAIHGFAKFNQDGGKHIITMSTEHKCVKNTCNYLKTQGFDITFLEPQEDGMLNLDELKNAIRKDTILISVMMVNNETGVVQNVKEIGRIAKENNIKFHTDAAQAFGKIPIDVESMNIDMMSLSAHKSYGPKGVGALYLRKKPRVKLSSIVFGGGQERGLRSGTLPVALICGFGKCADIAKTEMQADYTRAMQFKKQIVSKMTQLEDVFLNGTIENSSPFVISLSVLHIEGESLLMAMEDFCLSTGSACESTTLEPSYVITAMRKDTYYAHAAIRIGLGRQTTQEEVDLFLQKFEVAIKKMRDISPLWEMKQKGIDIKQVKWSEDHH